MAKLMRAQIAATTVDRHGDRFTVGALRGMVDQVRDRYLPVIWDHDIRYVPLGRVVDANVIPLEGGEFALETVSEYWTSGDNPESVGGDGRRLALDVREVDGFETGYDRGFAKDPEAMALIEQIARLGRQDRANRYEKKALEPVATLVISAGIFAVGAIAAGFLGEIGADGYRQLKGHLRALFQDRIAILDFNFGLRTKYGDTEVHVVVDPPARDAIDGVFEAEFSELDLLVEDVIDRYADVAKIVAFWKDGSMTIGYVQRSDAFPVEVNWRIAPELTESNDEHDPQ